jgi:hypothetical protein
LAHLRELERTCKHAEGRLSRMKSLAAGESPV